MIFGGVVRKILDLVKAEKRTSFLTAPVRQLVCDPYGIPVPKEGVAKYALSDEARDDMRLFRL